MSSVLWFVVGLALGAMLTLARAMRRERRERRARNETKEVS